MLKRRVRLKAALFYSCFHAQKMVSGNVFDKYELIPKNPRGISLYLHHAQT